MLLHLRTADAEDFDEGDDNFEHGDEDGRLKSRTATAGVEVNSDASERRGHSDPLFNQPFTQSR